MGVLGCTSDFVEIGRLAKCSSRFYIIKKEIYYEVLFLCCNIMLTVVPSKRNIGEELAPDMAVPPFISGGGQKHDDGQTMKVSWGRRKARSDSVL